MLDCRYAADKAATAEPETVLTCMGAICSSGKYVRGAYSVSRWTQRWAKPGSSQEYVPQ